MRSVLQDVRYALRLLVRSPGTTAVCILTLGLAIGASTAIFSVVSAVTLKPLPYRDPDQLVRLYTEFPNMDLKRFWISPPEYFDLRKYTESYQELGAYGIGTASVAGVERPVRIPAAYVTHTMLPLLGVAPFLGRTFTADDDRPGDPAAVILGYDLWRRAYGADPDVIGKKTTVDAIPVIVVGVMPKGFDFPGNGVEAWVPAGLDPAKNDRGSHWLNVVGRLKPGKTLAAAQAETVALTKIYGTIGLEHHWDPPTHPLLAYSLTEEIIGPVRPALWLLQGAVLVVLLIAVANIANLLLARAEGRSREVAVRAALGAEPRRLARQFLTESLVLGFLGGGVGVLFAVWGIDLTLMLLPEGAPRASEIGIDGGVLLFAAATSIGAGLLFGLAPLFLVRPDRLHDALKEGGRRTSSGRAGTRLRNGLVVAETAMALILVVGCGILLRSFVRVSQVDLGFEPRGLLSFELELPTRAYPEKDDSARTFWLRAQERLRALPGVTGVTLTSGGLPPVRVIQANDLALVGRARVKGEPPWNTDYWSCVGDGFFPTLGLRLVEGRALNETDDVGAPLVVVVNQAFARRFFPEGALGKQIHVAGWREQDPPQTIVGIVNNVKQQGLEKPAGTEVYFTMRQMKPIIGESFQTMTVLLKTAGDPMKLAPTVQRVVRELDPQLPVSKLRTVERVVWEAAAKPRFLAFLVTVFAGLALLIAAVGVYGVMSYSVAQRTQEIGIRMALGAPPARIRRMILARALIIAAVGCVLGIAGAVVFALGLERALTTLLYETPLLDPITLVVVPLVVLVVATLAAWFPARRATRVDPMTCLRSE